MDDNELKLFGKFPFHFFIINALIFLLSGLNILFKFYNIFLSMVLLIAGIYYLIHLISANIFKKIGFIINKERIIFFNIFYKKSIYWKEIVGYNITGNIKKDDLYLNFQTKDSLKNKGNIKNKNVVSISTKLYRININELIEKINKIKDTE
jgi:hypothetical protein